jgi:hypothetical protein
MKGHYEALAAEWAPAHAPDRDARQRVGARVFYDAEKLSRARREFPRRLPYAQP